MKIKSVATIKGGVGKSSFIFHMAGFLAAGGSNVLVIDADPQANTTSNFGIDNDDDDNEYPNLVDIIEGEIIEKYVKPEQVIIKSPIEQLPTLDLLPSSIYLTGTEFRVSILTARERIFQNWFERNKEYFDQYDIILADTNPSMSVVNQNLHVISDGIILISDISRNAYKGTKLFTKLWTSISKKINVNNKIEAFIINRYDRRISLSDQYIEYCRNQDAIKDILMENIIPENIELKKAETSGLPINLFNTKCTGFEAYRDLFIELIEKGVF
jgi:chromosome partitioning protein